jgi:hypothetical protein
MNLILEHFKFFRNSDALLDVCDKKTKLTLTDDIDDDTSFFRFESN